MPYAIHLDYFDPAVGKVPNPGMGLQGYVHSDHMRCGFTWADIEPSYTSEQFPLDRESFGKMAASRHCDNFYYRVDWRDIQKEKGKLHLPESFQWMLEACEKYGKTWSFRVMSINPSLDYKESVPEFIKDKVEMVPFWRAQGFGYPRYMPKYSADYLKYWEEMNQLMGEKFDKDPLLEYVDVSGYGFWGEAHHYCLLSPDQPEEYNWAPENEDEINETLLNMHLKAYPTTPICMNIYYRQYAFGRQAIADNSVWIRRDSFQAHMYTDEYQQIHKMTRGGCMVWEPVQPHIMRHNPLVVPVETWVQRCIDYGVNYFGVAFNPWDFNRGTHNFRPIMEKMDECVGYRLRPAMFWRRSNNDGTQDIAMQLLNDGAGVVPGVLTLEVIYPEGTVETKTLQPGEPYKGGENLYIFPMPKTLYGAGESEKIRVRASLTMRGKTKPVRWAVRQELFNPYEIVLPLRAFVG